MEPFEALRPEDPAYVGPYRIMARLGAGGMGHVYLGQSRGGRAFAVKVLRPELARDHDFQRRFVREVASARRVNGVFTAGVVDADPEGSPAWLATAYVAGIPLNAAIAEYGSWPEKPTLALAAALAEALEAIHAAGVVHRDLKPSNVLLAPDGPRVIDFGISLPHGSGLTAVTGTGVSVGTPGFMSPEQLKGDPVGPASDVFSLGAVLAFVASGAGPFGSGSVPETTFRIVFQEPRLDALPPRLRSVVARCLAKDPHERPTVGALLDELAASVNGADAGTAAFTGAGWLPAAVARAVHALGTAPQPSPGGPSPDGPLPDGPSPDGSSPGGSPSAGLPPEGSAGVTGVTLPGTAVDRDHDAGATLAKTAVADTAGSTAAGAVGAGAAGMVGTPVHPGSTAHLGAPDPGAPRQDGPASTTMQLGMGAPAAPAHPGAAGTRPAPGSGVPAYHAPPTSAAPPGLADGAPALVTQRSGAPAPDPGGPPRRRRTKRGRGLWATVAVCGAVAVGVAGWLTWLAPAGDGDKDASDTVSARPDAPGTSPGPTKSTGHPGGHRSPSASPSSETSSAAPEPTASSEPSASSGDTEPPAHGGSPHPSATPTATPSPSETAAPGPDSRYSVAFDADYTTSGTIAWFAKAVKIGGSVVAPEDGSCTTARFTAHAADGTSSFQERTTCGGTKTFGFTMDESARPEDVVVDLLITEPDGTERNVGSNRCTPGSCG